MTPTLAAFKLLAPWLGAGAALAVTLGAAGGWQAHRLASAGAVEAAQTEGFRRGQAFARCVAELQTRSANLTAEEAAREARRRMDAVRLILLASSVGCAKAPSFSAPQTRLVRICPEVEPLEPDFATQLLAALEAAPPEQAETWRRALAEWRALRERARGCKK